jgi:23S rRNA pseudouridine1911/1915/1917 synthase
VLRYFRGETLLEAFPETGRTHQIRVHLASVGHPLLGDPLYGRRSPLLGRQFLHAHFLAFHHPTTGERMEFTSPLPPDLQGVLDALS